MLTASRGGGRTMAIGPITKTNVDALICPPDKRPGNSLGWRPQGSGSRLRRRRVPQWRQVLGPVLKLQRGDSRITESVIHGEPSILEASDAALRVARRSVRAG